MFCCFIPPCERVFDEEVSRTAVRNPSIRYGFTAFLITILVWRTLSEANSRNKQRR